MIDCPVMHARLATSPRDPAREKGRSSPVPRAGCGRAGHRDQREPKLGSAQQPGERKRLPRGHGPGRAEAPSPLRRGEPRAAPSGAALLPEPREPACPRGPVALVTSLIPQHAWLSIPHPLATASQSRKERASFCLTFRIAFSSSNVIA